MPADYEITDGILVVRAHGQLTGQDFATYLEAVERDPRYRSDLPRLVLVADDTTFPQSSEIILFASKNAKRSIGPDVRFAFVVRTPLASGIVSMYMGNAGLGDNYQLFSSEVEARSWLAGS